MSLKVIPFSVAEHLETKDDIVCYLNAAMEGNDAKHIASAIGDVVRSRGMSSIAKSAGVGRQALHTALSGRGNPTLRTITSVLGSLGLQLAVRRAQMSKRTP